MKDKLNLAELTPDDSQRLPEEPEVAYQAYRVYCELGPGRTLSAAWCKYREGSAPQQKRRGRPRFANTAARRASGQWTQWCSRWNWVERALQYDRDRQKEQWTAQQVQLKATEHRRLQFQMQLLETLEQQIIRLDVMLEKQARRPVTGVTRWRRETVGKKVIGNEKERVSKVDLWGLARLVQEANETACFIICLVAPATANADQRDVGQELLQASDDIWGPRAGESGRAYAAYCFYRDLGPDRSLRDAYYRWRQGANGAATCTEHLPSQIDLSSRPKS